MASREYYDVNIECTKCGKKGVIEISENDYPFMKKLGRQATCKAGGFDVSMKDETRVRAICSKCGHENSW